MPKYSDVFQRDWEFYYRVRDTFDFSGHVLQDYMVRKGVEMKYHREGATAKRAFFLLDSQGKLPDTCSEPILFAEIMRCKASVNLHIKMYAEDRWNGTLPYVDFEKIIEEYNTPGWFEEAVERQKDKLYKTRGFPY